MFAIQDLQNILIWFHAMLCVPILLLFRFLDKRYEKNAKGLGQFIPDQGFRDYCRLWIGLPLYNVQDNTCQNCGKLKDKYGDHTIVCKNGGRPIQRHDKIVAKIIKICNV